MPLCDIFLKFADFSTVTKLIHMNTAQYLEMCLANMLAVCLN